MIKSISTFISTVWTVVLNCHALIGTSDFCATPGGPGGDSTRQCSISGYQVICKINCAYGCQPKNRGGPPKSSILIGFSIINHPFWGTPFLETPIYMFNKRIVYLKLTCSYIRLPYSTQIQHEHIFLHMFFFRYGFSSSVSLLSGCKKKTIHRHGHPNCRGNTMPSLPSPYPTS